MFAAPRASLQHCFNMMAYRRLPPRQSVLLGLLQNAWAGEICAIAKSTAALIVAIHEDPFGGTTTT
jgi:hypothetical protein